MPDDPAMMSQLLSAYCVGVCTSRTVAVACERHVACIAMVGDARPDFRTISDCRTDHLEAFIELCVHVLRLAKEAGVVQRGNVSTDGTQLQGKASRHTAMRYGAMTKEGVTHNLLKVWRYQYAQKAA